MNADYYPESSTIYDLLTALEEDYWGTNRVTRDDEKITQRIGSGHNVLFLQRRERESVIEHNVPEEGYILGQSYTFSVRRKGPITFRYPFEPQVTHVGSSCQVVGVEPALVLTNEASPQTTSGIKGPLKRQQTAKVYALCGAKISINNKERQSWVYSSITFPRIGPKLCSSITDPASFCDGARFAGTLLASAALTSCRGSPVKRNMIRKSAAPQRQSQVATTFINLFDNGTPCGSGKSGRTNCADI